MVTLFVLSVLAYHVESLMLAGYKICVMSLALMLLTCFIDFEEEQLIFSLWSCTL